MVLVMIIMVMVMVLAVTMDMVMAIAMCSVMALLMEVIVTMAITLMRHPAPETFLSASAFSTASTLLAAPLMSILIQLSTK